MPFAANTEPERLKNGGFPGQKRDRLECGRGAGSKKQPVVFPLRRKSARQRCAGRGAFGKQQPVDGTDVPLRKLRRVNFAEQQLDSARADSRRICGKGTALNPIRKPGLPQRRLCLRRKLRFVRLQKPAHTKRRFAEGWILRFEKRDDRLPQAVAPCVRKKIGAVSHMGKSVLREIRLDLRTGDGKHGPDEPLTPRRNAAESGKTGAAREIQEHGFQIVVLRVRRCN